MNVTFTGKIIAAEPYQQGTSQNGQPWASQSYVIEELNQQYPARAVIQVYGSDKLQQFNIQVGEIITAHIGMKANQSRTNGRWFNQLDCWKVERPGAQQPQQAYVPPTQPTGQTIQSQVGQPQQQGSAPQLNYPNVQQPTQQFPPQVDAAGQPINQQPPSGGGQPVNQGLPFPPMNQ